MKTSILTLLFSILSFSFVQAQVPGTWTVNPSAYTNSMNVTCKLNQVCTDLENTNNVVAAFVGGQCRGVAQSTVIVNGSWLAYLTVYSNTVGETVTFQVYNAETNLVFQGFDKVKFNTNGLGGVNSPFLVTDNYPPTDIALSAYAFMEDISIGTMIATLSATDNDVPNIFTFSLPAGELDNNKYLVSNDQLLANSTYDYDVDVKDTIRITVADTKGCTYTEDIILYIGDVDERYAPTDIALVFKGLKDQDAAGTLVGILSTTDIDQQNNHIYSLGDCSPNADNAAFMILHDSIFTKNIVLHDETPVFSICIRTTDEDGLYYEKSFQLPVEDSHDPEDIILDNLSIREGNTADHLVGKLGTIDGDADDTFTYELLPGEGDEDNEQFYTTGDALYIAGETNYDVKNAYHFRIRSSDTKGAFIEKSFTLSIEDDPKLSSPLPVVNYISPNDDGRNDYWAIQNVAIYKDFSLRILDQFGNVLYSKNANYQNEWDGRLNGRALPDGNYYFIFENGKKIYKGNITIVNK